jgi:hypothetical protein
MASLGETFVTKSYAKGLAVKKKSVKITGVKHTVKKVGNRVVVDHAGGKGKKWDKIDLSKKAGVKTVKQGVAASRKYHSSKPHGKGK